MESGGKWGRWVRRGDMSVSVWRGKKGAQVSRSEGRQRVLGI